MIKRTVAALIALVMLVSVMPLSSLAATTPDSWFTAEMSDANVKGLLTANASKDYQRAMTRVEFCEIVVRMAEEMLGRELELPGSNIFTDTNSENVQKAYRYGIVNGRTETTFDPNATVTREEIAAMMYRALSGLEISLNRTLLTAPTGSLSFNDSSNIYGYAADAVRYAVANDIFRGDNLNNFNPKNNITSQECVAVVVRSYNSMENKINPSLSQLQLIEKTLDRLHIGFAHGDIPEAVSQNIILPTVGAGGIAISWTTSNSSVISTNGIVNPTGASVTLTATVSLGGTYRTKAFELTTTTLTGNQKLVSNAKTALKIGFYNENDSIDSVTGRVFLPTTVLGLDVTWYSDRPSTVTTAGIVNVPNDSSIITVNLTASFNYGGVSGTKIFTLSVRNPRYAANTVSLHNIKLGMSLSEVNSVLNNNYANAYTLLSGETWYTYHSTSSYNNFIAIAYRSNKVVGVYTMVNGWESYLRDADNPNRTITVTEANAVPNITLQTFTDSGNSNKAYAAFMYDSSSVIATERVLIATATEGFIAELVNAYRYLYGSGTGKNELTVDTLLSNSARSHSTDMDNNNYFNITGSSGSTFQTRAYAASSNATVLGGAIAYNSINPFDFLDAVIKNSSYRSYILSASAGQIGIGYSGSYTGAYKNLLTMVFSSSTAISNVTASPSSVSVNVGYTSDVNFTFLPSTFTESFTVTSSNTSIFTVAAYSTPSTNVRTYRVTGIKTGTAHLYVHNSSGALLLTIAVTVSTGTYATAISVSPVLVEAGKSYKISASTMPENGPVVTWALQTPYSATSSSSSYQKSVSSINASTGTVATTSVTGTATVRASAPSSTTSTRTADAAVYVASVTLPSTNVTLTAVGNTYSIAPTISCGSVTTGFTTTYQSSNTSVAKVNANGLITAVNAGTATITITVSRTGCVGTIVKTVAVTVQSSQFASSVSIKDGNFSLEIGAEKQLTAVTVPATVVNNTVTWGGGNPAVATVSSTGLVKAIGEGSVLITVSLPGESGTTVNGFVTVTVTKKIPVLTATNPAPSLTLGIQNAPMSLLYTMTYGGEALSGLSVIWSSSNENVAKVENDVLLIIGTGTTVITGYSEGNSEYGKSNSIAITLTVTEQ